MLCFKSVANNHSKSKAFAILAQEASSCTRCTAMCGRQAVLSTLNGRIDARIMFIGEAPGRKGADRTRVPFSGDQSGANLDRFLNSIQLPRDQIFITSAALCNPRTDSGANRKPTQKNCPTAQCFSDGPSTSSILVVVTLGKSRLRRSNAFTIMN